MIPAESVFLIIIIFSSVREIAAITPVDSCDDNQFNLPEVELNDCNQQPCIFLIGTTVQANMTFRSPRYLERISPKVIASTSGIDVPYPIWPSDACDSIINTPCPLAENEIIVYHLQMDVYSFFPEIGMVLTFSITDLDNGDQPIMCFKVDAQTKRP